MDNAGIAVSKDGIGGAVLLEPYVAWLKTIRRVQQEKPEWQAIKLISFGMAGWDEIFMNKLVEVGTCWMALHCIRVEEIILLIIL